ncbi:unnamed protein product [Amoebophrya sp. A120]|nr:unnamed protein product [Amoebophrya sp. A120]|eukprot:GSA120T00010076001.1
MSFYQIMNMPTMSTVTTLKTPRMLELEGLFEELQLERARLGDLVDQYDQYQLDRATKPASSSTASSSGTTSCSGLNEMNNEGPHDVDQEDLLQNSGAANHGAEPTTTNTPPSSSTSAMKIDSLIQGVAEVFQDIVESVMVDPIVSAVVRKNKNVGVKTTSAPSGSCSSSSTAGVAAAASSTTTNKHGGRASSSTTTASVQFRDSVSVVGGVEQQLILELEALKRLASGGRSSCRPEDYDDVHGAANDDDHDEVVASDEQENNFANFSSNATMLKRQQEIERILRIARIGVGGTRRFLARGEGEMEVE